MQCVVHYAHADTRFGQAHQNGEGQQPPGTDGQGKDKHIRVTVGGKSFPAKGATSLINELQKEGGLVAVYKFDLTFHQYS